MTGIEIPKQIQGHALLGKQKSKTPSKIYFGSGDRFDEFSDRIRSLISKDFFYAKNYHSELPTYKDVGYRKKFLFYSHSLVVSKHSDSMVVE
ncbi:MAG: N-sulfoglucosamine sulfohydrolase [Saprospiraceae bacterium]